MLEENEHVNFSLGGREAMFHYFINLKIKILSVSGSQIKLIEYVLINTNHM